MATLTQAQRESLEEGGLSQGCVDNHFERVCPHCGACQRCSSGCGCENLDAPKFVDSGASLEDYFEHHGGRLWKANDPTEAGRWAESIEDARAIASEDPSLLYAEEL